jgi:predicted enzyme related to lactoylglutathione lyase
VSDWLPTSNVFYCDDLAATYEALRPRGVEFPPPPVELGFGSWSMFQDEEGDRFALHLRARLREPCAGQEKGEVDA